MYTPRQRVLSVVLLIVILLTLVLVFVPPSFAGDYEECNWTKVGCCYIWKIGYKEKNDGHCVYWHCDTTQCVKTGERWFSGVCRVWWC